VEGSGGHRQGQSQLVAPCLVTNLSPLLSHNISAPSLVTTPCFKKLVGVLSEEDLLWKKVEATDKVSHNL